MSHATQYTLALRNDRSVQCDARVEVDGKHVGTWRIYANSSIRVEHPVHDAGHFTCYRANSDEARIIHMDPSDPSLGLVRVTFTPEQQCVSIPCWWHTIDCYQGPGTQWSYTTGVDTSVTAHNIGGSICGVPVGAMQAGTGLSGHSDQQYGEAQTIEHDFLQQTVIHLRLVVVDDKPRPLVAYPQTSSTPIPPPIR